MKYKQRGGNAKLPPELLEQILLNINDHFAILDFCKTNKTILDTCVHGSKKLKSHIAKLHLTKFGFFIPSITEPSESRPTKQLLWNKYKIAWKYNKKPPINLPPLTDDQIIRIYKNLKTISPRFQINEEVLEKLKKSVLKDYTDGHFGYLDDSSGSFSIDQSDDQLLLEFIIMNLEKAFVDINTIVKKFVYNFKVSIPSLDDELNRLPRFI